MAMPASGNIAILDNTLQTCSSISCAVDGNATPPKCLTALGVNAGFSSPYCMSDFYGYTTAVTYKCLYFTTISSTCPNGTALSECTCSYIVVSAALSAGETVCPTFYWNLSRGGVGERTGTMVARICCNGSIKCSCCLVTANAVSCNGNWTFPITQGDSVCIVICAVKHVTDTTLQPVSSYICVSAVAPDSCFCKGTPISQQSYTCGNLLIE